MKHWLGVQHVWATRSPFDGPRPQHLGSDRTRGPRPGCGVQGADPVYPERAAAGAGRSSASGTKPDAARRARPRPHSQNRSGHKNFCGRRVKLRFFLFSFLFFVRHHDINFPKLLRILSPRGLLLRQVMARSIKLQPALLSSPIHLEVALSLGSGLSGWWWEVGHLSLSQALFDCGPSCSGYRAAQSKI